ncbi:YncE family protein [Coralloluteibacterium thermophilus]|uniref:Cytochrome D1 domain-containing protein n=1 Tax=Coralloluteibacterium thermophilum TaxID=2707049 RepID=A0ABV9NK00_9GAMM
MSRWILLVAAAFATAPATVTAADTLLVGNKADASVWALSTETGLRTGTFSTGDGPHEVVVSPDRSLAVVGDYGTDEPGRTLTVINWPERKVSRTVDLVENTRPHGLRFIPDSHRVVVTTEGSQRVLVVDLGTGRIEHRIDVGGTPHMVALSPDGRRAYATLLREGGVAVIDVEAGEVVGRVATGEGAEGVDVTPDGREVWVGNRAADTVSVIDAERLEVVATLPSASFPIRVVLTPDGRHALVTNARSAELAVFDVARREEVARIALAEDGREYRETMLGRAALPIGAIVHPDGSRAFVAVSGGDEVAVIDTSDWSVAARWATGAEPDALALIPAGGGESGEE